MIKRKFAKLTSLAIALVMIFSCFGAIQAYAATSYGNLAVTLPYAGTATPFITNPYDFTDNSVMGTITVSSLPQTHRLVVDVGFKKSSNDTGVGDVQLTLTLVRSNGQVAYQKVIGSDGIYPSNFNSLEVGDNISVSPGEVLTVKVDASSENPAGSNGNYRSIYIYNFDLYCD